MPYFAFGGSASIVDGLAPSGRCDNCFTAGQQKLGQRSSKTSGTPGNQPDAANLAHFRNPLPALLHLLLAGSRIAKRAGLIK